MLVGVHEVLAQVKPGGGEHVPAVQHGDVRFRHARDDLRGDLVGVVQHVVARGQLVGGIDGGVLVDEEEGNLPGGGAHVLDVLNRALHGHVVLQIEQVAGVQREHLAGAGVDHALAQGILEAGIGIAQLRRAVDVGGEVVVHRADARGEVVPGGAGIDVVHVGGELLLVGGRHVDAVEIGQQGHRAHEEDDREEEHRQHNIDAQLQPVFLVWLGLIHEAFPFGAADFAWKRRNRRSIAYEYKYIIHRMRTGYIITA